MSIKIFLAAVFLIFTIMSSKHVETKNQIPLINSQATEKTAIVCHFVQDIRGKHILSGQHNFVGKGSDYSEQPEEITGKKAIMWCSGFSFCVEGEYGIYCRPSAAPSFNHTPRAHSGHNLSLNL